MGFYFNFTRQNCINDIINYDNNYNFINKNDAISLFKLYANNPNFQALLQADLNTVQSLLSNELFNITVFNERFNIVAYKLSLLCSKVGSYLILDLQCSQGYKLLKPYIDKSIKHSNFNINVEPNNNIITIKMEFNKENLEDLLSIISSIKATIISRRDTFLRINLK